MVADSDTVSVLLLGVILATGNDGGEGSKTGLVSPGVRQVFMTFPSLVSMPEVGKLLFTGDKITTSSFGKTGSWKFGNISSAILKTTL